MTSDSHHTTPESEKPVDNADSTAPEPPEATSNGPSKQPNPTEDSQDKQSKAKAVIVMVSAFLSMFLVGLDRTIISTAIPRITDEFHSLNDVGWYGSAYLLTSCALQLLFGKIYKFCSVKRTLLFSILLFEISSAICGAAPNSVAFIIGRAICGIGAAGIFAGVIVCIVHIVPLQKRPQVQGMFGAVMGIASIVGPLIGGGFTSNVSWRWCFYINLPIGGVAMLVIFFCLDIPNQEAAGIALGKKVQQLDVPGTIALVPGVVCLLLALQWGGQIYAWHNARIIALFVLAGILLIAFMAVQISLPTTATLPPHILKQRSVVAGFWATLCINCGNYIYIYFLPIWFQSVKGVSAAESGIRTLPLMLSVVAGSISGGILNSKLGYYTPLAIIGSCVMSIGAGLLTTFQTTTTTGRWIGYQLLYGIGLGLCFQTPNLAAQTSLPKKDVPIGLALMLFGTLIGAAVFVSVGENVLAIQLVKRLSGLEGFTPDMVTTGGATSLVDALPENSRHAAIEGYNQALRKVFLVGLIPSCLSVLGTASLEWRSVKKPEKQTVGKAEKTGDRLEK